MARVGHLVRRKQVEIERAVRLLRAHFIDRRPRAPKRGTLYRIVLVGPHAQPTATPDRETGEINGYDLWAFVDHPAYRGMNRYWGLARRVVASSLRGRAADHARGLHDRRDRAAARYRQSLFHRSL